MATHNGYILVVPAHFHAVARWRATRPLQLVRFHIEPNPEIEVVRLDVGAVHFVRDAPVCTGCFNGPGNVGFPFEHEGKPVHIQPGARIELELGNREDFPLYGRGSLLTDVDGLEVLEWR